MRIQETDRILKESRIARHAAGQSEQQNSPTMFSKMWRMVSGLFHKH